MTQSEQWFARAQQSIPGGVNSPVRAFKAVGTYPRFIERAEGAYLYDADGNRYLDYVLSWGPLILGHAHPAVVSAVKQAAELGTSFGAPTSAEVLLAEQICELVPSIDSVRLVNSGTEATMTAIRLARGVTQRDKIIKFAGGYHGHVDSLLVNAGSGALTYGVPSSPGVPESLVAHTLTATYNDIDSVKQCFQQHGGDIAAVIVEPIAGNMNCVPATQAFLSGLRELCDEYQTLLIFDEVITGFRVGLAGAQGHYNVMPDLTTLGKIIGGGLPIAAFGGRRDIMANLSPEGPVYQAGTLSGNPLATAAGLANLAQLRQPGFYERLAATTDSLLQGIAARAEAAKVPLSINAVGSMFGLFFTEQKNVTCFSDVMACDVARFTRFFQGMLDEGIYLAPSAYEMGNLSIMHGEEEIAITLAAAERVFAAL